MERPFIYWDTHIHLDRSPLKEHLAAEVSAARSAGVNRFVVPGVDSLAWDDLIGTVRSVDGAVAAPGLHPGWAGQWNAAVEKSLRDLLTDPEVAAVGEIGLDAHLPIPRQDQERALRGQLRLALEHDLPVLLHCRRADGRLLQILREEGADRVGGIWHSFSGSYETARMLVAMGFCLGFGGVVTFLNARKAPDVLRRLPPEAIVLETDAPDMAPHPYRDQPNSPRLLPLIAQKVAQLRGWSEEDVARWTTANARRVLKLGSMSSAGSAEGAWP